MRKPNPTIQNLLYDEQLSSSWTTALFIFLTVVFLGLSIWRLTGAKLDLLAGVLLFFSLFFFFYVINYRTLIIRLTHENLKLKFGIFTWTIELDNIESCRLDDIAGLMRYGGAGIHFMLIRKRYRASFNFLEYPRVVITLKQKVGLVRDISFSTRQPDKVLRFIQEAILD